MQQDHHFHILINEMHLDQNNQHLDMNNFVQQQKLVALDLKLNINHQLIDLKIL